MGFNKRYINEKIIRDVVREDGLESLIKLIKKPDALITEDDFSSKVCGIIKETEEPKILDRLIKETNLYTQIHLIIKKKIGWKKKLMN